MNRATGLCAAVDTIPAHYAVILHRYYVEEQSIEEIALVADMSKGGVAGAHRRPRTSLAQGRNRSMVFHWAARSGFRLWETAFCAKL